jgi:hypothetical protein
MMVRATGKPATTVEPKGPVQINFREACSVCVLLGQLDLRGLSWAGVTALEGGTRNASAQEGYLAKTLLYQCRGC